MKISLILIISAVLISSCSQPEINIIQRQPQVPVLKLKDYNNVLDISIGSRDTDILIKGFSFDLSGTTRIGDIEKASIYFTGNKGGFISEKLQPVSETKEIKEQLNFSCSVEIKDTLSHFMLSLKLKDNADISGRIAAACTKIVTNRGNVAALPANAGMPQRLGVALRKHNDDEVDTYRIPGLAATKNGTLLACYDVRRESSRDLQGNIDIGISRSTDGGLSWEPMSIALDMSEYEGLPQKFNGVSDASLLVDQNSGVIFVAGLWMHGVLDNNGKWIENLNDTSRAWNHQWRNKGSQPGFSPGQTSQFIIARSTDDGKTWSEPVNLTRMCKKEEWWLWAPAPGNGITMDNGTLVLPTQGRDKTGMPFSNITFSTDKGKSWKTSSPAYSNTTECTVAETAGGMLMLNMRYNLNRNNDGEDNGRVIAVTSDMGETWKEHQTSRKALPEPVCMASLYKHMFEKSGTKHPVLFFSNPDTKKGRHHITIKASLDSGESWPEKYRLMLDEGSSNGYSCITSVDKDHIGILYESSQANLVFQRIAIKEILNPPESN